jgi:hypothetical protein
MGIDKLSRRVAMPTLLMKGWTGPRLGKLKFMSTRLRTRKEQRDARIIIADESAYILRLDARYAHE